MTTSDLPRQTLYARLAYWTWRVDPYGSGGPRRKFEAAAIGDGFRWFAQLVLICGIDRVRVIVVRNRKKSGSHQVARLPATIAIRKKKTQERCGGLFLHPPVEGKCTATPVRLVVPPGSRCRAPHLQSKSGGNTAEPSLPHVASTKHWRRCGSAPRIPATGRVCGRNSTLGREVAMRSSMRGTRKKPARKTSHRLRARRQRSRSATRLAVAVLERKGFPAASDFRAPSTRGSTGPQAQTRVRDVMERDRLPVLPPSATMRDSSSVSPNGAALTSLRDA
jgi:hypothetical protein